MAEKNNPNRLFLGWCDKKIDIESFLTNPLEWVANELQKIREDVSPGVKLETYFKRIEMLTEIIRFIDANRNLLIPKKYTGPSTPPK
jgi:2-hydroxy-3-keto-5-methylthiopentenyl-1-phosphate phosphatase